MAIRVRCNACGGNLDVGQKYAGRSVECPACGASVRVPGAATDLGTTKSPVLPRRETVEEEQRSSPTPAESLPPVIPPGTSGESTGTSAEPSTASRPRATPRPDLGGFHMGKKRPVDQEEMDLTPMVDMTFLLLIFFMITASFSVQKSMQVPPPSSDKKGAAQEIQSIDDLADSSITVRVDERNVIYIDDEPLPGSQRLSDALLQKFNAQRNELLLSADEGALHDTVIAVIDAANEIGVQKIRMVAASKD
jgi:biopolymer transport protein ExbD